MILKLKPYPEYKQSGASWLDRLPAHWELRRLKTLARMKSGDGITSSSISDVGDYPVYGGNGVRGYTSAYTHDGEFVLIGRQGALCGNVHVVRGRFWASEHAVVASTLHGTEPKWYAALLRAMNLNQYSLAAAQPGLAVERVQSLLAPVPPSEEQLSIVRFLEDADRRIGRYISARRKLIALLEEHKQAIIQRAVTRGLDPNVGLKPSSLEFLGNMPEHWEILRNGRLFAQRNQTGFSKLPVLEVSLRTGIRIRNFDTSTRKQVMSDRDKYKRAVTGDIAYNMMRMWQGAVGVAPVDGLVSPAYVVARPLHGVHSQYFSYLFRTSAYMTEVDKYSRGIVKDRNRLYWQDFKQMPSPCPPSEEQVRIADAIEAMTRTLNVAMEKANRELDLVREYRTRLIADVVTGKLDVREAAAQLPESEPEDALDSSELLAEPEAYADDTEITENEGLEEVTADDAVDA